LLGLNIMNKLDVHYRSSWEVMPAIFDQILNGVEDEQSYTIRKYGRHQGSVRVRLVSEGSYDPAIGSSGSLEVAYIAGDVHRFVLKKFLKEYFGLDNPVLKSCLKDTFISILKGSPDRVLASDESSVLKLGMRWNHPHAFIEGQYTEQLDLLCHKVQSFIDRLDAEHYLGKL
jgi:hypothetical protein